MHLSTESHAGKECFASHVRVCSPEHRAFYRWLFQSTIEIDLLPGSRVARVEGVDSHKINSFPAIRIYFLRTADDRSVVIVPIMIKGGLVQFSLTGVSDGLGDLFYLLL